MVVSGGAESDVECPKCGLDGDNDATWICSDHCNTWYDLECAGLSEDKIKMFVKTVTCILETLFNNLQAHYRRYNYFKVDGLFARYMHYHVMSTFALAIFTAHISSP